MVEILNVVYKVFLINLVNIAFLQKCINLCHMDTILVGYNIRLTKPPTYISNT